MGVAMWPYALCAGKVRSLGLIGGLASDSTRQRLSLNLDRRSFSVSQADLSDLCAALGELTMLESLSLIAGHSGCVSIAELAKVLCNARKLEFLHLDFAHSSKLNKLGNLA